MDWTEEDLAKPQVLVDSAYGMGHPGTFHFRSLIEEVSNGVFESLTDSKLFSTSSEIPLASDMGMKASPYGA
jgi:dihydroxy-acid dehydratase